MHTIPKIFFVAIAGAGLAMAGAANAFEIRAGSEAWQIGQAGIYVNLSPAVSGPYSVVVQPSNTAGYSPTGECTYFNVLKETPTQFQVQHKTCKDGTPVALDTGVTLAWILVTK